LNALDRDRAASLADEGGASAALVESQDGASPEGSGMPKRASRGVRRYGEKASQKVERAMHEMKRGELRSGRSGRKVKSRKQAIAIGLSQARKAGAKVPRPRRGRRTTRKG
jgi:hypothetical protein